MLGDAPAFSDTEKVRVDEGTGSGAGVEQDPEAPGESPGGPPGKNSVGAVD